MGKHLFDSVTIEPSLKQIKRQVQLRKERVVSIKILNESILISNT